MKVGRARQTTACYGLHILACMCTRTSAVTRCNYYMILTAKCKNFDFFFNVNLSLNQVPPLQIFWLCPPLQDPKSPLSNSASGMHCVIDKSLCVLLLLNPSLADQILCLIAMPGKGLVKLFPSVVIRYFLDFLSSQI